MSIESWWPQLTDESRSWLIEHNGEPLDPTVKSQIVAINEGNLDPSWWAGESSDGASELTDEAIDWIETTANDEQPTI